MHGKTIERIAIIGGGTAGWMAAALFARLLGPLGTRIRLVESEEIGTVGVGEATVPTIQLFNRLLGFDERDFVARTQGSFKLGIEFRDWGGPGHAYFHGFGDFGAEIEGIAPHHHWLKLRMEGDGTSHEAYSFPTVAARMGRFAPPPDDPASSASYYNHAYHFDAALYARYLRDYAEGRGVERIEGRVVDVARRAGDGFIEAVVLADRRRVEADFFVDCTGFRALLIGEALGVGYEDWRGWLPCDRAVAIPCARGGPLTPYTIAAAKKAGWRWRIPLQHRVGNGYVYCSAHVSDDEAAVALRADLEGSALAEPRLLRFAAGRRKAFWSKNCVAIGLAAGFLEPLESTSIQLIQNGLTRLIEYFPDADYAPAMIAEYNRITANEYARVRDFLILHYAAAGRRDAPLWRACAAMSLPDELKHKIDVFVSTGRVPMLTEESYAEPSWVAIFLGNGAAPRRYDPLVDRIDSAALAQGMRRRREEIQRIAEAMPTHEAFIERLCPAPAAA
ncbi:MAG: tryptophan 7-halogenase [Amphiplicatus sp.]